MNQARNQFSRCGSSFARRGPDAGGGAGGIQPRAHHHSYAYMHMDAYDYIREHMHAHIQLPPLPIHSQAPDINAFRICTLRGSPLCRLIHRRRIPMRFVFSLGAPPPLCPFIPRINKYNLLRFIIGFNFFKRTNKPFLIDCFIIIFYNCWS